jgi:predicted GNAT family N-acyltransferase
MSNDNVVIRPLKNQREFKKALEVRHRVFVSEQQVAEELEQDGLDPECIHFIAKLKTFIVGTGRLREIDPGTVKIERMAVLAEFRNRGIGRKLLDSMLDYAREEGYRKSTLHAQKNAINFYKRADFILVGKEFKEAGIPH